MTDDQKVYPCIFCGAIVPCAHDDDALPFPENVHYGCTTCDSINHTTGDTHWCPKERDDVY